MRKIFTFISSILLLLTFSSLAFADYIPPQPTVYNYCPTPNLNATHATWYFDVVNGSDTTGDGSQANPWKNIQTAFTVQGGVGPFYKGVNPSTGVINPGDVILLQNGNYGSLTIGTSTLTNPSDFLTISNASGATGVVFTKISIQSFTNLFFNGVTVQSNGNGSPSLVSDSLVSLIDNGSSAQVQNIIFQNMIMNAQANVSTWTATQWVSSGINGFSILGSSSGANIKCVSITHSNIFNVIAGIQLFATNGLIQNNQIYMTGDYAIDTCGTNIKISTNRIRDGNSIDGGDVAPTENSSSCSNIEAFNNIVMRQSSQTATPLPPLFYDGIVNFDSDITKLSIHNNLVITDAQYGIGGSSFHNSTIKNNTILQDGTVSTNGLPSLFVGLNSTVGSASANITVSGNFAPQLGTSVIPFYNKGTAISANNNLFLYNAGNGVIFDYDGSGVSESLAGNSGSSTNYTQAFSSGINTVDKTGGYTNQIRSYNSTIQVYNVRPVVGSLLSTMHAGANGFGTINPSIFAFNETQGSNQSGDLTAGVLPAYNDASANWQMAGLQSLGGISAVDNGRVACTSAQAGETLPLAASGVNVVASNDDYNNIQNAINNCPVNTIINLAAGSFTMDESEFILMNKSQTLRGAACTGNTNHAYCSTSIVKRNGAVAYHTTLTCGTTCQGTPVIMMSNNGRYNSDWSGCHDNVTGGTQDGNTCTGTVGLLTADAAQGDKTVTVNTVTPFSVGMWVLIDEDPAAAFVTDPVNRGTSNPKVWASPDMFSTSGSPATGRIAYLYFSPNPGYGATSAGGLGTCTGGGCPGAEGEACDYAATCFRPVGEIHKIIAIDSVNKKLTFDSPLTVAMRQSGSHNAHVYYPTAQASGTYTPFLTEAGVENLTLGRGDGGDIQIIQCAYCWVNNVDAWGWAGGAVSVSDSARVEINGVYGYDCFNNDNNGNEYAYSLNAAATEVLLTNSIARWSGKSMVGRAGGNGSVVSYNYFDDNMYESDSTLGNPGTNWIDFSANASHFPGAGHVLFEGNRSVNGGADMTHGSGVDYITYFRNHLTGYRSPYVDPTNSVTVNDFTGTPKIGGNVRTFMLSSYNYWHAVVGNVLGMSGASTSANGWHYNDSSYLQGINYNIFEPIDEYTQNSNYDPNLNFTSSSAFFFEHGNYDYYHNSIFDWHSGYSHTLPNSFYLTSKPSFFNTVSNCTYAWPQVTPTAASQLQTATGSSCVVNTTATATSGSTSMTVASATGIKLGMIVSGGTVQSSAIVTAISGTTITMDVPNTGVMSGASVTFSLSGLPAQARFQAGTPFVQP